MAAPIDDNTQIYHQLLQDNVYSTAQGRSTVVDYSQIKKHPQRLTQYLEFTATVARPRFDSWPKNRQLAFLINVYNAATISLVLTGYPKIDSIKNLGHFFSSPWKKRFIPLFGKHYTLDEVEHGLIRGSGRYNDPRIHFAVNCASIGCPALRAGAYTEDKLNEQLEEQTKLFLTDHSRNRLQGDTLYVSQIFDWYRQDFTDGWRGSQSLGEFFALYSDDLGANARQRNALTNNTINIKFLSYDWNLNDAQ